LHTVPAHWAWVQKHRLDIVENDAHGHVTRGARVCLPGQEKGARWEMLGSQP
jgi:hypothetical protein